MVEQGCHYVQEQKNKYLVRTLIWMAIVALIFCTGLLLEGKRENYFTVIAGVLVLGIALNLSRYIGFRKFKDGKEEEARLLEEIRGHYHLVHSAIIPDTRETAFFEHIIVTSRRIYFIGYSTEMIKKYRLPLEKKLMSKGIGIKSLCFIAVENKEQLKDLIIEIEEDAYDTDKNLEEYAKIINDLLM